MAGSRPARGGWIEMILMMMAHLKKPGPAPHGAGGLKCISFRIAPILTMVPPRTGRVD